MERTHTSCSYIDFPPYVPCLTWLFQSLPRCSKHSLPLEIGDAAGVGTKSLSATGRCTATRTRVCSFSTLNNQPGNGIPKLELDTRMARGMIPGPFLDPASESVYVLPEAVCSYAIMTELKPWTAAMT